MIADNIIRFLRVLGARIHEHLGKLYVISSDKASFEEMCANSFSPASQLDRTIAIEPCLIGNPSDIQDEPLRNVVEEFGANIIGAVLDSEQGSPSFLLMRASEDSLFDEAGLFAFKVDKYNRDALTAMMQNMAVNDPEGFSSFMSDVKLKEPVYGITRGGRRTHVQKQEDLKLYMANFTDNIRIVRNSKDCSEAEVNRANYEVLTFLSSVPHATLVELMRIIFSTGEIPDCEFIKDCFLNLDSAANKSDIDLIIRPRTKDEKMINSDGKYHLTFSKGENAPRHIRFPGKVETTIFYTVMVARKTTGAKNIEILDLEKEFIGIYRALYVTSYDEAKLAFEGIKDYVVKDENGEVLKRYQGRYRNYIPNIRAAIDAALGGSGDTPAVFYYNYSYRKGGFFHVNTEHIKIDADFLADIKRLQDPQEKASFLM